MIELFRRKPPHRAEISTHRRVRELEVVTARLMRAGFAGQYHAAFHGRGVEFAQVREYMPGDDVRVIDWNVTARTGVPHVKEFVEERDLTVVIALDCSGSMGFGSLDRRKADLAAELTAVLAFAANQNGDRVGLVTFDHSVRSFVPPRRGRKQIERIVRQVLLDTSAPGRPGEFSAVSRFLHRVLIKRSVVLVLSDFLDPAVAPLLQRLDVRHDLVALILADPREDRLPKRGMVRLVDAESGARRVVDLRNASALGARRREEARSALLRRGIDAVTLSTAEPYERALIRFFDLRTRRRRR